MQTPIALDITGGGGFSKISISSNRPKQYLQYYGKTRDSIKRQRFRAPKNAFC